VAVLVRPFERDPGDNARLPRVRHVDDRGTVRGLHVPEKCIVVLNHDLTAARQIEVPEPLHAMGKG
jgi:hypothetical protein